MKPMENDWYKKIWTLDIQNQSWVKDTKRQIDFVIEKLHLKGDEKILDLACGFGRHSLELARRGYYIGLHSVRQRKITRRRTMRKFLVL